MQGEHMKQRSFFGMVYEELIPASHVLCKLAAAVDLSFVSELVSYCYCPGKGLRSSSVPRANVKTVELRRVEDGELAWGIEYRVVPQKDRVIVSMLNLLGNTQRVQLPMDGRALDLVSARRVNLKNLRLESREPVLLEVRAR